jgi:hypothetical protein
MSELKPCPFCGELPIQFVKDGLTQIRCNNTQCWIVPATSFYTDRKTAVEAWEERAQPANEPLTIDELREMDGEPVFVASPGVEEYGHWGIVCGVDDTAGRTLYLRGDYSCHDYGKTWLAYRRQPEGSENDVL